MSNKKRIKEFKSRVRDLIIETTISIANIQYGNGSVKEVSLKEYKQIKELKAMRKALNKVDPEQAKKDKKTRKSLPF
jgi:hypothetical protein|tara:strand:+ start:39 stop:269 length:231 start_codon:yes stop_codon:yes gene_type:complete